MAGERAFRFGVLAGGATPDLLAARARDAERIGFSTFLVTDHLDLSGAHVAELTPIPSLAYAAATTSTIRLGTAVFNHDLRHPAVLAREAASLDVLSGGRFVLGIGAGHNEYEYDWAGIRYDEPRVRVDRFEEYVQVVKAILGEESASYDGRFFQIEEMPGVPRPVQAPRPPLLIGGTRKRMLSIAAREADIVGINLNDMTGGTAAQMDDRIEWIRAAAGERWDDLELSDMVGTVVIGDGDRNDLLAAELRRQKVQGVDFMTAGLSEAELLESPLALVGSVDQLVDDLLRWRERWGVSYVTLAYPAMERFAPVVERLSGR